MYYPEALKLASELLKKHTSGYGQLMSYSQKHNLSYNTLISLRNGKLKKRYPSLVCKVLRTFGYKCSLKKLLNYKLVAPIKSNYEPTSKPKPKIKPI